MTTILAQTSKTSEEVKTRDEPVSQGDDSLDLVRNILFGEQAKKTEERRLELENLLEISINSLRDETKEKFAGVSQELSALISLLTDETKARQSEFGQTRDTLNHLTQRLSQLDSKTQKAHSQLQEKLRNESDQTNQYIRRVNDDVSLKIEKAVNQLRQEKIDRKAIADLLNGAAQQLLDSNEHS